MYISFLFLNNYHKQYLKQQACISSQFFRSKVQDITAEFSVQQMARLKSCCCLERSSHLEAIRGKNKSHFQADPHHW